MRRRDVLRAMAAAPLVATGGCRRGTRTKEDDDALELVAPNDAATIDPRYASDVYGLRIARLVHATLVAPHPDTLAPTAWLAEAIDEDADGALVVTLDRRARFHDGDPILARDVVATFESVRDPALMVAARRVVEELATVEAIDGGAGRRVRFAARDGRPRAVLRGDLESLAILRTDEVRRPRGAPLTGCGPYAVAQARGARGARGGEIALVPAAAYGEWSRPARRPVVIRTVRDEAARALRLLGGRADVASNALSPPLALALPTRGDAPPGLAVVTRRSAATTFLTMHLEHPPLDRVEVRRAIAACVDRSAIVQAKLGDAAVLAVSLLPPTLAIGAMTPRPFAFAPARAREVLAPLGRAGVRLSLVTSADRARIGIARAIAQMVGDAGLPVDLGVYEFGTFFARLAAGDFDLAPLIASEIADPDVLRWYLHSTSVPPRGANRGRIRDPRIDALLDRGVVTLDSLERRAVYDDLEELAHATAALIPLWHEDHVAVVGRRAAGFRPSADGRWGAIAHVG